MGFIQYFKNASKEINHVVWPTHKDTRKYMIIVTITITLSTIFLYILSLMFENSFFALRNYVKGDNVNTITTEQTQVTTKDLIDSGAIKVETEGGTKIEVKATNPLSTSIIKDNIIGTTTEANTIKIDDIKNADPSKAPDSTK